MTNPKYIILSFIVGFLLLITIQAVKASIEMSAGVKENLINTCIKECQLNCLK